VTRLVWLLLNPILEKGSRHDNSGRLSLQITLRRLGNGRQCYALLIGYWLSTKKNEPHTTHRAESGFNLDLTQPTKTMGKKRKASSSVHPPPSLKTSAKLQLNSWEDVTDEQDDFLLNRDKILLDEGATAKRRRREAEEGWCAIEMAVFMTNIPRRCCPRSGRCRGPCTARSF
jgi:hypothetical protein